MKVYYSDEKLRIRSMKPEDAKVIYDTYYSYGWQWSLVPGKNSGTICSVL